MAVRVDREIFDPVGAGSTGSGGASIYDDGAPSVYQRNPWQPRPFTTRSEYIVSEALRVMGVPADQIRQIRPPFINEPFPPQFGYDDTPLTIDHVLDTDRWSPTIRSWTSGVVSAPRRADLQEDQWSGTLRNVSSSVNPAQ